MKKELKIIFNEPTLIVSLPLAFIFLFILKLLSPFLLVRFGLLHSDRIGHFAANTQIFLIEEEFNLKTKKTFDIFYFPRIPCNQQLAKMWKRNIRIFPKNIIRPFCLISRRLSFFNAHVTGRRQGSDRDINNLLDKSNNKLKFTENEKEFGFQELKKFGLEKNNKFVCLIVRDSEYLNKTFPQGDWSYHDFRDSNIDSFLDAAEFIANQGIYVFRMGKFTKKKFISSNKKIIDYSNSKYRTDFLDIYLSANCLFCISTSTGLDAIPFIFRKPIAYANVVPFIDLITSTERNLILFKKILSPKKRKKPQYAGNFFTKIWV